MSDTIFLVLFIVIFFPFLLINFQRIQKAQKEIIEQLHEGNRLLAEMSDKGKS
ncbi:MAG: hypothetical protein ABFD29_01585 [Anaerolineaceae bacterium]|jgi:preprotein translocase subunit YajC